ncbi:hypothetical protein J27TS7_34050 [Paenibacillus dendritiformis]|uniref:Rha family transcriptional regulator n=1 Tax=Paenibacillus dendritiformis TaxID=130049 RepID=UPI001B07A75B|nr:Rha family transcriptional regulator [Paenibacillus dendritiformis]GIO73891.1 hypothetical protein J27TS7_34050 [Paenibacillus dendritiformis]
MSKLILNTECMLYEMNGKALYSSRQVANEFDRQHSHVLRSIDEIAQSKIGLSKELMILLAGQTIEQFYSENFFEGKYKDASGKRNREVLMTRKGSMLIVMGFTGEKATVVKIGLLNRFEAMEQFIQSLNNARLEHPAFTQAIMDSKEVPMHYHFSNESDMINRIVLGVSAKKFREANGIAKGQSIRPYLKTEQIQAVEMLQRVDIGLLVAGLEFDDRKRTLTQYFERSRLKRIA